LTRGALIIALASTMAGHASFAQMVETPSSPLRDWSGAYAGAGVSYSTQSPTDETGTFALPDASGAGLSLLAGYAWQSANLVYGVEAVANLGNSVGTSDCCRTDVENFYLVRGRVGYAFGDFLVSGTLGLASDQWALSVAGDTASIRYTGIAVGASAEMALSDNLSLRGDLEYYDFKSRGNVTGAQVGYSTSLFRLSVVRSF
jgi:outer membrane immunogenic protein